jgi:hypothetical protein
MASPAATNCQNSISERKGGIGREFNGTWKTNSTIFVE